MIDWLREYIFFYVDIFKSLQKRKTKLLKFFFKIDNVRKTFSTRTRLNNSISLKLKFFRLLQSLLFKSFYLIHHDFRRQLFIDFDVNKEFELKIMMYHIKFDSNWNEKKYSSRKSLKSILFFSKLLNSIEIRYWSTELKLVDIVWIFKKIRYLIKSSVIIIVIYIDHDAVFDLIKQITFTTSFIDKFNLRLIRVFDYIQKFDLKIRHKLDKMHIVSNVLSRLINLNTSSKKSDDEKKLNALFIIILININVTFRNRLLKDYFNDSTWKKIAVLLNQQKIADVENSASLFFYRKNNFIFRFDDYITDEHAFEFRRFCVFQSLITKIFDTVHESNNDHSNFDKCYERIFSFYFIRELSKQLRDYLRHCSECQIHQTRRHKSYDSLQSIFTSSIFFHTIIIDFILTLFKSREDYDCSMSITCKFIKRVICICDKIIWSIAQWNKILLNRLNIVDWNIFKIIIFDRNKKFMSKLWTEFFRLLDVKLFYFIVYHSQIDDQSERTNQIVKIIFRFAIATLNNSIDWFDMMFRI